MAELSAGSGLETAAVRGRGGWNEFVSVVREKLSGKRSAVVAPAANQEELLLTDALPHVQEVETPKVLTRENFGDASSEEVVTFLKGLHLGEVDGVTLPEEEKGKIGIFGVQLSPEAKAAVMLLISEPEGAVEEGDLEKVQAAHALLNAELAVQTAPAAEVEQIAEAPQGNLESDARVANVGEFKVLSERFAMVQTDRGLMALLEAEVESADVHALIAELVPVMKARVEGAGEVAEGETPELLSFDEAKGQFEALLAELEKVAKAKKAVSEAAAREVLEGIVESGKGVGEITPDLAQGELTREDAAGAGDNHEVITVAETGGALVVVAEEGDQVLKDGRAEGEGENENA